MTKKRQIGPFKIGRVCTADCLEGMKAMLKNSIDTICTDPPYGLKFMSKNWDHGIPGIPFWVEALRVAKPGAILLAFGGTRMFHRLACAIEDAGWELRDCIMWVFGSGFPKSLDISKSIDRAAGAKREVVGHYESPEGTTGWKGQDKRGCYSGPSQHVDGELRDLTAPSTPLAQTWDGYGTALKPAWEPILVAMKSLDGTFAQNAKKWGVAGLWIDGGRVEHAGAADFKTSKAKNPGRDDKVTSGTYGANRPQQSVNPSGRWPANLIHDGSEEVVGLFPQTHSGNLDPHHKLKASENVAMSGSNQARSPRQHFGGDSGSAARFFYCAKASRREREEGLIGHLPCVKCGHFKSVSHPHKDGHERCIRNNHPTVKSLALMRYLVRLTRMPTGGLVLDPFAGSGTTGVACKIEGRNFLGFEKETGYVKIANRRILSTCKENKS